MVRSLKEIMDALDKVLGDNISDDALALIEDVNDTIIAGNRDSDAYDENGKLWRDRYAEDMTAMKERFKKRFFSGAANSTVEVEEDDTAHDYDGEEITEKDVFIKKEGD